jgi:hypothetical protein
MEQGISFGVDNVRDAVTLTNKRQLEPLVLPDDISKLPDLSGWLVFPQGFPAAKIKLTIRNWPKKAHGFIQRPDLGQPLKTITAKRPNGSDDSGVGITIEAQQVLRLPVQFDPERTAEMPESDEVRYERLNAEARREALGLAQQKSQAERRIGDDERGERLSREADGKGDAQDAPGATVQSTGTSIPDAGDTRPPKKPLEQDRGTEDLTKREARDNFGQGRDDRGDREDDMDIGL